MWSFKNYIYYLTVFNWHCSLFYLCDDQKHILLEVHSQSCCFVCILELITLSMQFYTFWIYLKYDHIQNKFKNCHLLSVSNWHCSLFYLWNDQKHILLGVHQFCFFVCVFLTRILSNPRKYKSCQKYQLNKSVLFLPYKTNKE